MFVLFTSEFAALCPTAFSTSRHKPISNPHRESKLLIEKQTIQSSK
jgi:hypothetical protein